MSIVLLCKICLKLAEMFVLSGEGGVLEEFLGGDVRLGLWNP